MYEPTDQDKKAIALLESERTAWEEGQVWVTDKVSYIMKNVVKNARKNFFGIFDEEFDPVTKRRKIFMPLTEIVVETILKNIDIDTKDIRVIAKKNEASTSAALFKKILECKLDKVRFGITLNKLLRNVVTDGTGILKAWKEGGELKIKTIDRLNIYVDPSVDSIDESPAITEVNTLLIPELRQYKDWANVGEVEGSTNVDRSNISSTGINPHETDIPAVKVYERYGYFSKDILTGNEEDANEYVYGVIIVSDLTGNPMVHKIKKLKEGDHPYQEFKFKDLLNRFDGRGAPEILFALQAYINEVVNTRLNTARTVQMGLWRVDPSVKPQELTRLFSTQAIKASQGAVERLNTGTIDPSSYKDEETINNWANRVTQTQDEQEIKASSPATNALIEERGANKAYGLVMEGIFLNLAKFIEEKVIPIIVSTLKNGEILAITGDPQDLEKIQEPYIRNLVRSTNNAYALENGLNLYQTQEEEDMEVERIKQELAAQGNVRYVEIFKKAFDPEYMIQIDPTDESVNRGIMVRELNSVIGTLTNAGVPITQLKDVLQEIYDAMGLAGEKLVEKIDVQPQMLPNNEVMTEGVPMEANIAPTEV